MALLGMNSQSEFSSQVFSFNSQAGGNLIPLAAKIPSENRQRRYWLYYFL